MICPEHSELDIFYYKKYSETNKILEIDLTFLECLQRTHFLKNLLMYFFITLYRPKNPNSRTTPRAETFFAEAISPATCRRILTISRGLVNMTWDAPACSEKRIVWLTLFDRK